jgi:hypothetical protein
MATKKFIPIKKHDPWLHLVRQKVLVEKHFPCFACALQVRPGVLDCTGEIQPCPECDTYKVHISLTKDGVPRVKIMSPIIQPRAAIHMYSNGTLCLYDHRDQPWMVDDNLYEKIIPWTAEWLVYYELFKLDGKWLGPEAPHGNAPKKPQDNSKP